MAWRVMSLMPLIEQTVFRICSISKMITAVAILRLCEQGYLRLDNPISTYIPDFHRGDEITIHHLLSHTSGVIGANLPLEMVAAPKSLDTILSFYKTKPLEFKPGADFLYSNAGYCALSRIIEKVSGKSFEQYIKETIAVPLGMHTSYLFAHEYEIIKNSAEGYCRNRKILGCGAMMHMFPNFRGAGGLYSTTTICKHWHELLSPV